MIVFPTKKPTFAKKKKKSKVIFKFSLLISVLFVQSLSQVRLFANPWTAARQSPRSFTVSRSLLTFMSVEFVVLYNRLILFHPHPLSPPIFLSIMVFSSEKYWASASASVLPENIQHWFSLGLTGLIFLQTKELWRIFSSNTIWKHQLFGTQSLWSNSHICTWLPGKP